MNKLIIANWKMFKSPQESLDFVNALKKSESQNSTDIVICPPYTSLSELSTNLKDTKYKLGAQNCHHENEGAFTGEISLDFLKAIGISYVIIGHSERRTLFLESNEFLQKKVNAALSKNIIPIYCVGETLEERKQNQTWSKIEKQLEIGLKDLEDEDWSKIVIAYEPVWAIGTGIAAKSEQAAEVHDLIRNYLIKKTSIEIGNSIPLLYGGSVKPNNINELTSQTNINGALVGSASLNVDSFLQLISD